MDKTFDFLPSLSIRQHYHKAVDLANENEYPCYVVVHILITNALKSSNLYLCMGLTAEYHTGR